MFKMNEHITVHIHVTFGFSPVLTFACDAKAFFRQHAASLPSGGLT